MKEWKECTIADLGEVVGGATPSTRKPENYENGDIAWITPKDLSTFNGRFIFRGERNITEIGLNSCSTRLLPPNTVLFSSRAPIGYVAIAAKEMCTNQGFKSVIPNADTDYMFLYYLLKYNRDSIENMGSGTTFKEVSGNTMKSIKVRVPVDKEEQQRIGAILSAIDDRIEQNIAINENLEQQAQALFKAWFVDFEPFGGVMPDDWRMGTLSEICGYSKDKVDIDDLTLDTYYSTENMQPNRQGAVQATTLPTIKQTTACKKGDVLISNIRPYFKKILYCFSDCGCSTDVLCFVPNKTDYSAFLYCALHADKFFDYMVAGSKGTKMPRGDKQQIMVYPICIPSAEYIEKFNKAVAPILETVYTNRIEANNLANLRDTLLPKLMNGEIDVSAVRIQAAYKRKFSFMLGEEDNV